jgi:hypothetical protein
MVTDGQVTTSSRKKPSETDRFSYIGAHTAVVRISAPESLRRQWLDAGANDDIARVLDGVDRAENHLFVVLAVALPTAFVLLAIFRWPWLVATH